MTHGAYPYWSFFVGGVAVYMGTIVLEGVSMSLTSKVYLTLGILGVVGFFNLLVFPALVAQDKGA